MLYSKVVERIVASRFVRHAENNHLFPTRQSSYRRGHSTELSTASLSPLLSMDLSSALDAVDHSTFTLLTVRDRLFGVWKSVMDSFSSYLSDRTQYENGVLWTDTSHLQRSAIRLRAEPSARRFIYRRRHVDQSWFSTVIKSIIIHMLITSRLWWAYLSIMCHWRVKHLNVVSVTSPRGTHHLDCCSTPLKQN